MDSSMITRPRKTALTSHLHFVLAPEERVTLETLAAREGCTLSHVARKLPREQLATATELRHG